MKSMLEALKKAEALLPALLRDEGLWRSVRVDYHPPTVERLWAGVEIEGEPFRMYLHRILPCEPSEALYHPHPWPSAMRILSGSYQMSSGHGEGLAPPPVSMTLELPAGASYEMAHPDGWHAVSPLGEPAFSLMITGAPWGRPSPKSDRPLRPLEEAERQEILRFFRSAYGPGAAEDEA